MKLLTILSSLLLVAATALSQSIQPSINKEKSCSHHPKLVGRCFQVRGRLSVYNGAPALRIWKIGTRRILGISEQRFQEPGYANLPEDIRNQVSGESDLFGDFIVCPFTQPRAGEMQLVCVESGKNLKPRKKE
jgi:hypothetical protein